MSKRHEENNNIIDDSAHFLRLIRDVLGGLVSRQ